MTDHINPQHYLKGGLEVWDMELQIWGPEKFIAHLEMAAFEYRMRAGTKEGQPAERDIEKALKCEYRAREVREKYAKQDG